MLRLRRRFDPQEVAVPAGHAPHRPPQIVQGQQHAGHVRPGRLPGGHVEHQGGARAEPDRPPEVGGSPQRHPAGAFQDPVLVTALAGIHEEVVPSADYGLAGRRAPAVGHRDGRAPLLDLGSGDVEVVLAQLQDAPGPRAHSMWRLPEVHRAGRPVGELGALHHPVRGQELVRDHLLHADDLVQLTDVAVDGQHLLAFFGHVPAQAVRAHPHHGRRAVEHVHRRLALGDLGRHLVQVVAAGAPVPVIDHAIVVDELEQGHAVGGVDAVLQVVLAQLAAVLHVPQVAGRPAIPAPAHHPFVVMELGDAPEPAVLPARDQAQLLADVALKPLPVGHVAAARGGMVRRVTLEEPFGRRNVQEARVVGILLQDARNDGPGAFELLRRAVFHEGVGRVHVRVAADPRRHQLAVGLHHGVLGHGRPVGGDLGSVVDVHVVVVLAHEPSEAHHLGHVVGRPSTVDQAVVHPGGNGLLDETQPVGAPPVDGAHELEHVGVVRCLVGQRPEVARLLRQLAVDLAGRHVPAPLEEGQPDLPVPSPGSLAGLPQKAREAELRFVVPARPHSDYGVRRRHGNDHHSLLAIRHRHPRHVQAAVATEPAGAVSLVADRHVVAVAVIGQRQEVPFRIGREKALRVFQPTHGHTAALLA